jgi:hypothetical protein
MRWSKKAGGCTIQSSATGQCQLNGSEVENVEGAITLSSHLAQGRRRAQPAVISFCSGGPHPAGAALKGELGDAHHLILPSFTLRPMSALQIWLTKFQAENNPFYYHG